MLFRMLGTSHTFLAERDEARIAFVSSDSLEVVFSEVVHKQERLAAMMREPISGSAIRKVRSVFPCVEYGNIVSYFLSAQNHLKCDRRWPSVCIMDQ